ncbi:MAG: amino acid decarboxylase, partial [Oscillospiraceae bacterium]
MTPLYEALLRQISTRRTRFHMPGHKGMLSPPLDAAALFDLTELPLTGCLTDAQGAPAETEALFSRLYGSGATLLSTGGSTQCI